METEKSANVYLFISILSQNKKYPQYISIQIRVLRIRVNSISCTCNKESLFADMP